jgi:hypothetical protein
MSSEVLSQSSREETVYRSADLTVYERRETDSSTQSGCEFH